MKNKGIIINGGKLNSTNLAVGKNSKIEIGNAKPSSKNELTSEISSPMASLKQLIAQGHLKEAIQKLLLHFKDSKNEEALNNTTSHSASFAELERQERLNLISHEQARIDRAKVTNAVLSLIDNEINKYIYLPKMLSKCRNLGSVTWLPQAPIACVKGELRFEAFSINVAGANAPLWVAWMAFFYKRCRG